MNGKLAVLLFYSSIVAAFGFSHRMLDKDSTGRTSGMYHGRYTRDIPDPEMLIPRRVTEDGSFLTFTLPNFYDRGELEARKKRAADDDTVHDDLSDQKLHLVLPFNGANNHVELTPHHEFISPDMVIETRGEDAATDLNNGIRFKRGADLQCHYRGHVRGHDNSRAALSLCEGVVGHVQTDHGRYFIEPVEESVPDEAGQHVHIVYKRTASHDDLQVNQRTKRTCGTSDDWEAAWAEQMERRNRRRRLTGNETSSKRDSGMTHSIHRYVEIAIFCDKRFLEFHKGTDYEQYILTILNMVTDYYHDASIGNQMDVVIVRIVYLEKQEKEIDLFISPEAEKTLRSFAVWQNKQNPKDIKHPNHHDIGVLITRYDICSADEDACHLLGLANLATACDGERAACINEDAGLLLGITVAHELGHVLGCGHDEPDVSGCKPEDKDNSSFVMSPFVDPFTLRWSPCSRKFITSFVSSLGDCLTDNTKKPNEKYKFPGMLPGAMYDTAFQCDMQFPNSTVCQNGADICTKLWCQRDPNKLGCSAKGPPADGTKCGENKWCIRRSCTEMGKRPAAVHGGWSGWGQVSECSRTCGGGLRVTERECDNPTPKEGGRYCLGERFKYSTCNTSPCEESKPAFRALQCSAFDSRDVLKDGHHTWSPFVNIESPCKLYCINEQNIRMILEPVVKDGTPCKAGTKNMCISGSCRKVGCDWVLNSDAEEDQCGICKGDGTQCTPVEGDYTDTGKSDYRKIVTIPRGSRNIRATEKKPSTNTLAVKLEKGDKYVLNGGHEENRNGEYPCAGDILVYDHPEPQKEELMIKGPIEEDIQLQYVFYQRKENVGVHYIYYTRNTKALGSTTQYLWDFLAWGPCSAKCGGGTQLAEASCVEHLTGKVGNSFCKDIPRPQPKTRICDNQPCGAKWRVSQWSSCSGCGGKQGQQRRKVQCVKPAARADGDDVQADLSACKGKAPKQTLSCTGTKPCKKKCAKKTRSNVYDERDDAYSERRSSIGEQRNNIDKLVDMGLTKYLKKQNSEHVEGKRDCPEIGSKDFTTPKSGTVIKDNVPMQKMVVMEAPMLSGIKTANLSDQAFEEDGDDIGVELDTNKMKVFTGAEAIKELSPNPAGAKSSAAVNDTCE